ncbi:hypothetical protein [Bradyrhizobium hereditatis]|uniref:hypothetical protein n=1 Tax=Bradyrhizobium hereditatis TaxID=2821405 RepID=UPI001CE2DE23|nr:hypothetical protein [Bradyrhizobium hereditatis]
MLADNRASFEIEGERPPRNRLERWGRAVVQAGKHALTLEEIVRLHGSSSKTSGSFIQAFGQMAFFWVSETMRIIRCLSSSTPDPTT